MFLIDNGKDEQVCDQDEVGDNNRGLLGGGSVKSSEEMDEREVNIWFPVYRELKLHVGKMIAPSRVARDRHDFEGL